MHVQLSSLTCYDKITNWFDLKKILHYTFVNKILFFHFVVFQYHDSVFNLQQSFPLFQFINVFTSLLKICLVKKEEYERPFCNQFDWLKSNLTAFKESNLRMEVLKHNIHEILFKLFNSYYVFMIKFRSAVTNSP